MTKKTRSLPAWLLPLLLALPLCAACAWAMLRYGAQFRDAVAVMLKVMVIS